MKEDLRIGLIAPLEISPSTNPGCHIITSGARALLRRAFPLAKILPLEMLEERPSQWVTAKTCDVLILCGNPRFWLCDEGYWWDTGIWHRLLECQRQGITIIDGWAGSCYPLPLGDEELMANDICHISRNQDLIPIVSQVKHHITRDKLHQRVYSMMNISSVMLPCPSIWCNSFFKVRGVPFDERNRNALILHDINRKPWLPQIVKDLSKGYTPVTVCERDYNEANAHGIASEYIYDPESLLTFLGRCKLVISFRIHGSVAAVAIGCWVCNINLDSRSLTLEPFIIKSMDLDSLQYSHVICLPGYIPDMDESIKVLRGMTQK